MVSESSPSSSSAPDSTLHVSFIDRRFGLAVGDELTFGRAADLVIDDNMHLHRVAGRFLAIDQEWFIDNVGSTIVLSLRGASAGFWTAVQPGQRLQLAEGDWVLKFRAGRTVYEIEGRVEGSAATEPEFPSGDTEPFGVLALTDLQRITLVAMAEDYLGGELHPAAKSNKAIASRIGTKPQAVERRIDKLANRFAVAGVPGLKGSEGASAKQRRELLARHVIAQGLIGPSDLALLDD